MDLTRFFPKYFERAGRDAQEYRVDNEKIANVVYANRMDNATQQVATDGASVLVLFNLLVDTTIQNLVKHLDTQQNKLLHM